MVSVSEQVLGNYFCCADLEFNSQMVASWRLHLQGLSETLVVRTTKLTSSLTISPGPEPEPPGTRTAARTSNIQVLHTKAAKRVEDLPPVERQEVLPEEEHWTASQSDVIHHKYLSTLVGT